MSQDTDTARTFYEAARAEILERMKLREQVIVLYVTGVAATFGTAFANPPRHELLLLVPFLTLAATIIASHHSQLTGALGYFCANELGLSASLSQWDSSNTYAEFRRIATYLRLVGELLVMLLPAVSALLYLGFSNHEAYLFSLSQECIAWWTGVVFVVLSLSVQIWSTVMRERYFQRIWPSPKAGASQRSQRSPDEAKLAERNPGSS